MQQDGIGFSDFLATDKPFAESFEAVLRDVAQGKVTIFRLSALSKAGVVPHLERLPFSIRILLEGVLRSVKGCVDSSTEQITGQPVLYKNSKGEMVRPYNVYH